MSKTTDLNPELAAALTSQDGGFDHEGKVYTLAQPAYADGTKEAPEYRATATDAEGNTYAVRWAVKPSIAALPVEEQPEDESDMCDWSTPVEVRLVERAE